MRHIKNTAFFTTLFLTSFSFAQTSSPDGATSTAPKIGVAVIQVGQGVVEGIKGVPEVLKQQRDKKKDEEITKKVLNLEPDKPAVTSFKADRIEWNRPYPNLRDFDDLDESLSKANGQFITAKGDSKSLRKDDYTFWSLNLKTELNGDLSFYCPPRRGLLDLFSTAPAKMLIQINDGRTVGRQRVIAEKVFPEGVEQCNQELERLSRLDALKTTGLRIDFNSLHAPAQRSPFYKKIFGDYSLPTQLDGPIPELLAKERTPIKAADLPAKQTLN